MLNNKEKLSKPSTKNLFIFVSEWHYILDIPELFMEKAMVTHSRILAWRIAWIEEPGWLQSLGSERVRHD